MNKRKRILLVDDDAAIRTLIVAFLGAQEYDVTQADTVSEAMEALSGGPEFDLAILDFWLGNAHAVSIVDAITAQDSGPPIIMISGGSHKMDLETTEAVSDISGAAIFLQKPFRKDALMQAVRTALSQ